MYERTDAAGNKIRETDQCITDKSFARVIQADTETKQIGTSNKTIDSDNVETVGGNKTVHVLGNIEEVTASNKTSGVGSPKKSMDWQKGYQMKKINLSRR